MISYSRILPLLIIVAVLAFSVRLTEVVTGISNLSSSAYAKAAEEKEEHKTESENPEDKAKHNKKDKEHAEPEKAKEEGKKEENKKEDKKPDDKKSDDVEHVEGKEAQTPQWRDASDSNLDIDGIKLEMFQDLSERRNRLDQQEEALQVREALLKAAEKELDRKVGELESLRTEIKGLLEEQGGQEEERINSLVKIYEGMKPKDAARIFDTLDLDVLVRVMSKMSERKVAPVLAAMNAERARTVTIMLAEERALPLLE